MKANAILFSICIFCIWLTFNKSILAEETKAEGASHPLYTQTDDLTLLSIIAPIRAREKLGSLQAVDNDTQQVLLLKAQTALSLGQRDISQSTIVKFLNASPTDTKAQNPSDALYAQIIYVLKAQGKSGWEAALKELITIESKLNDLPEKSIPAEAAIRNALIIAALNLEDLSLLSSQISKMSAFAKTAPFYYAKISNARLSYFNGVQLFYQSKFPDSLAELRKSIDMYDATFAPGAAEALTATLDYGNILQVLSKKSEALEHLNSIKQKCLSRLDDPTLCQLGRIETLRGVSLIGLNQAGAAIRALRAAIFHHRALNHNDPERLETLSIYATVLHNTGLFNESTKIYAKLIPQYEALLGPTDTRVMIARLNYATSLYTLRHYQTAFENTQAVLNVLESQPAASKRLLSLAKLRKGEAVFAQGDIENALELMRQALEIRTQTYGENHPELRDYKQRFAIRLAESGAHSDGLALVKQDALNGLEKGNLSAIDHTTIKTYIQILYLQGEIQTAYEAAQKYFAITGKIPERRQAENSRKIAFAAVESINSAGWAASSEFYQQQLFSYAQLASYTPVSDALRETLQQNQTNLAPEIQKFLEKRQKKRRQLIKTENNLHRLLTLSSKQKEEITQTLATIETLQNEIALLSQNIQTQLPTSNTLDSFRDVNLSDLQKVLLPTEAFIHTITRQSVTYTFVIRDNAFRWKRWENEGDLLCQQVANLRLALDPTNPLNCLPKEKTQLASIESQTNLRGLAKAQRDLPYDKNSAAVLYDDWLGFADDLLVDAEHLILSASGVLSTIPAEALIINKEDQAQYLIERSAISYAPAPTDFGIARLYRNTAQNSNKKKRASFLGVGAACHTGSQNPNICDAKTPAAEHLSNLEFLPGSEKEVRAIAKRWRGDKRILLKGDATENQWRILMENEFNVILLALHGLSKGESGALEPSLALTPTDPALPDEDGYLTADELANGPIAQNAFVILSACNSAGAGGAANNDTSNTLIKALFTGGASGALMTISPIDDSSAVQISTAVALAEPSERHKALQIAMKKAARSRQKQKAHPRYWAAFRLMGDF